MDLNNPPNHITVLCVPEHNHKKLTFVCDVHGELTQSKRCFLNAKNCFKCLGKGLNTADYLNIFNEVHNCKYQYASEIIRNTAQTISIICTKHGKFTQKVSYHKHGSGCPKCKGKKLTVFERITSIKNKYPHLTLLSVPSDIRELVTVNCAYHGEFTSTLYRLKKANSCKQCRYQSMSSTRHSSYDLESAVRLCNKIHNNKYNYSNITEHTGVKSSVHIICPKHGKFTQLFYSHLAGHGCPSCRVVSAPEIEIQSLMPDSSIRNRIFIKPLEVDLINKKHKLAIEYNGLMWHSFGKSNHSMFNNHDRETSDKYKHLNKTQLVEDKGYQLLHIFEDEWLDGNKKQIWKSVINIKTRRKTRNIQAKKCTLSEVSHSEASNFLESNHLQGKCNSSIRIGLYHNDELLSLMTFELNCDKYQYKLIRFCCSKNVIVHGGGKKLLKYFEMNYKPCSIVSYANRRWSNGNLYEKLGFEFSHCTEPNYFYFKNNLMVSRIIFQELKGSFNPELTETQNMFNNGFRKIYDSGNLVYTTKYF